MVGFQKQRIQYNDEKKRQIYTEYITTRKSLRALAEKYGISLGTMMNIVNKYRMQEEKEKKYRKEIDRYNENKSQSDKLSVNTSRTTKLNVDTSWTPSQPRPQPRNQSGSQQTIQPRSQHQQGSYPRSYQPIQQPEKHNIPMYGSNPMPQPEKFNQPQLNYGQMPRREENMVDNTEIKANLLQEHASFFNGMHHLKFKNEF
jgi:transposase-like protein